MDKIEVLSLCEQDVRSLITIEDALEAVELAFRERARGHAQMPPKVYLNYPQHNGDLRTMPAYLENLDISTVKVVSVHPENNRKFNLPTVRATILLIDPKNGQLLAIMSGATITAMRTGAAGGIAAKYLASNNPKVVAFIGAGSQARTQLSALHSIFPDLKEIRAWDIRPDATNAFLIETKRKTKINTVFTDNIPLAVEGADIIVTTTPSTKPLIQNDWVQNGTHFNCIGADAPGKEELDPAILRRSKIIVDDWTQASHSGEINIPVSRGTVLRANVWAELGEIVAGIKPGRTSTNEITVFDSTGLAIQDAATAELVYRRALEKKVGNYINL